MKTFAVLFPHSAAVCCLAAFLCAGVAHSAPTKPDPKTAKAKTAKTNAPPVEIPESVFVTPATVKEGRDPFFPLSIRPYEGTTATNRSGKIDPAVVVLKVNGFGGQPDAPLVIINGKTFAKGDEQIILTSGGRTRVRCVDIKMEQFTAIVEVNGETRELRMPH